MGKIKSKRWTKEKEENLSKEFRETPYDFDKNTKKKIYTIDTPPPYINAPIHIGHATVYSLMDMYARFHRMNGEEVLFPLGLDNNGLPIEVSAEKKNNVKLHELPREEALKLCKEILNNTSSISVDTFARLGISFSSWDFQTGKAGQAYMTDMENYRSVTQDTFIQMWNKGLIYFDKRINNYSPGLQTTIADSEIEYEDLPSKFVYIKWQIKETNEQIIIATTRPELIASCGMVIFNPEDKRFQHLEGKTAILPIYGKEVPIKAHTDAKTDKGSGLVMMCSAGDYTDIRFFREQRLTPIISISIEGKMNSNAGFLEGLEINKARTTIIEKLQKENLIEKIENVIHRTPICERSKVPVEFIEMEELYLKQMDFVEDIKKISNEISFYDPKNKIYLDNWLNNINIDWPISRRRFYATEIPLWYCKKCGKAIAPQEKGKYHQPWKDPCPIEKCPECSHTQFKGETRVFDTWFDSSISPLFNLRYGKDKDFFEKAQKCSLRPQGKEIVRTWLYYSLLRSYLLFEKPIFEDVWVHHHVVDENGEKMSKSKGNGINPLEVIDKFGSEAFRLWSVLEGNIHQNDLRCSFERIESNQKTINKIWNIAKFISNFEFNKNEDYILLETDKWILHELDKLIEFSKTKYEKYDFHNPAKQIKHFIWETFSSHYLELVKNRAYENNFTREERNGAIWTLRLILSKILKLWAPVIPLVTYQIYNEIFENDIHKENFPELITKELHEPDFSKEELEKLNGEIWKFKKDNGLSLKNEIEKITIPNKFNKIKKDLKSAHNIKIIEFGEKLKLN